MDYSQKKYFMLLSLINWKSEWYKEHSIEWLKKLFNDYNTCLTVTKHTVKEQWITNGEKWRVLAIAKTWNKIIFKWTKQSNYVLSKSTFK